MLSEDYEQQNEETNEENNNDETNEETNEENNNEKPKIEYICDICLTIKQYPYNVKYKNKYFLPANYIIKHN
jgi:hypothetical protein